jgi:hypothetical protein
VLLLLLIPWIEGAVSNFFWQKICTRPSCKKPYNSLHKISDKIVNPRSWWGETIIESKSSLASTHYKTHNQKTLRIISDVEQLSQEFMDHIDMTKPEKKSTKKLDNIWYRAWSYCFSILIIFLVNFEF